jgi:hypothetical protein
LATPTEQKCSQPSKDCSANIHTTKPTAGKACQANLNFGTITVARGVPTRHVWRIVKTSGDKGQYEWDLANGIEIIKDKDHQVVDKGITSKGDFWIMNANSVPGSEIEYLPHVRLIVNHSENQKCNSVDPKIINSLR